MTPRLLVALVFWVEDDADDNGIGEWQWALSFSDGSRRFGTAPTEASGDADDWLAWLRELARSVGADEYGWRMVGGVWMWGVA